MNSVRHKENSVNGGPNTVEASPAGRPARPSENRRRTVWRRTCASRQR